MGTGILLAIALGVGAQDGFGGPLQGLPSKPGPHADAIRALGDGAWIELGAPAPDPAWGRAPGRSWCCTMPFSPEARGAFLYGEGVHGHVKPGGRYMDDCWFYDLNGHRWICVYPGTDAKEPGLKADADGFPVDAAGRRTPVSLCVHAYDLLTYDLDRRQLMLMGTHEYHFATPAIKALLPTSGKVPPSSPWRYDLAKGTWDVRPVAGLSPEKAEGTLLYLPGRKKAFYRSGKGEFVWFYDPAENAWTRVAPKGPRPPFGIDPTACHDPKRDRVYIGGGSYPSVEEGKNALWIYDLKTDAWIDPQPAKHPLSHFATNYATMRYDPVADVVLVAAHAEKKRGIHVYDPGANAWSAEPLPFPAAFPTRRCVNGFYDPAWNVHVFHAAGDSRPDGTVWVYRHRRATPK
jgi:hypothetical protein